MIKPIIKLFVVFTLLSPPVGHAKKTASKVEIKNASLLNKVFNEYKKTGVTSFNKKNIKKNSLRYPSTVEGYHSLLKTKSRVELKKLSFILLPNGRVEVSRNNFKLFTLSKINITSGTFFVNKHKVNLNKVKNLSELSKRFASYSSRKNSHYNYLTDLIVPEANAVVFLAWVPVAALAVASFAAYKTSENTKYIAKNAFNNQALMEETLRKERLQREGVTKCKKTINDLFENVVLTIKNTIKICSDEEVKLDPKVTSIISQEVIIMAKKRRLQIEDTTSSTNLKAKKGVVEKPQVEEEEVVKNVSIDSSRMITVEMVTSSYTQSGAFSNDFFRDDPNYCAQFVIPALYEDLERKSVEPNSLASDLRNKLVKLAVNRPDIVNVEEETLNECYAPNPDLQPENKKPASSSNSGVN